MLSLAANPFIGRGNWENHHPPADSRAGSRRMTVARIAGVNIPTNKRVIIALQYIHGIGPKKASEIMTKVGIPEARRVAQLTDQEVLQISRNDRS